MSGNYMLRKPKPKYGWSGEKTFAIGARVVMKSLPRHGGVITDGPFDTETDGRPETSGGIYWKVRYDHSGEMHQLQSGLQLVP